MSNSELACVYAALILADDDVAITVSLTFLITQSPTQFQLLSNQDSMVTFGVFNCKRNATLWLDLSPNVQPPFGDTHPRYNFHVERNNPVVIAKIDH